MDAFKTALYSATFGKRSHATDSAQAIERNLPLAMSKGGATEIDQVARAIVTGPDRARRAGFTGNTSRFPSSRSQ